MAAKRYWRLFILHNDNNGFLGIDKIQMADTAAGPNLATVQANGSASSTQGGGLGGDQCFNGAAPNTGTLWQSNVFTNYGYGEWVKYDFGAGNAKDIIEIRIAPNWGAIARTPYTMRVQSSNDNISWADEWIIYKETGWVIGAYTTFSKPAPISGAALCWAVYGVQASPPNTSPHFEAVTVAMRANQAGPDLATGGTAIGWRHDDGVAANAFDGNATTWWGGLGYNSTVSAHFIGYVFAAPVTLGWIDLTCRAQTGFSEYAFTDNLGEVWVSNDGVNFLVKAPWTVAPFTGASQTKGFAITVGEGAIVDQLMLVGINREYETPIKYVRFGVSPAAMAVAPLYIQKGL